MCPGVWQAKFCIPCYRGLHFDPLDVWRETIKARPFWLKRLEDAWRKAPIVCLCGVRRTGKTTLAESLGPERTLYLNCDLATCT